MAGLPARFLVVSADGKLFETGSRLPHCFLSQWVYITGLHEGTLPLQDISLKTLHFLKKCALFFFFVCIKRPCCLTTSESNGAAEKWLPPWQALRPRNSISTFYLKVWALVDVFYSVVIATVMTMSTTNDQAWKTDTIPKKKKKRIHVMWNKTLESWSFIYFQSFYI